MIGQILSGTPIWVWLLLVVLVYLGWMQSADRAISRQRAFMLPIAMVLWSFSSVLNDFSVDGLLFWGMGAVSVTLVVRLLFSMSPSHYDPIAQRYHLKGSWVPMWLILGIFITKYVVGGLYEINPAMLNRSDVTSGLAMLHGGFSGAFIARAWGVIQKPYSQVTE